MDERRLAPAIGIAGCLLVLVVLAAPYALVETGAGTAVGTYYGAGAISPLLAGAFALVTVIVLAAGREGRTDPGLAAGIGVALGCFAFVVSLLWAVTVPADVVVGMSRNTLLESHRWALVAASLVAPVTAGWYARALGIF